MRSVVNPVFSYTVKPTVSSVTNLAWKSIRNSVQYNAAYEVMFSLHEWLEEENK